SRLQQRTTVPVEQLPDQPQRLVVERPPGIRPVRRVDTVDDVHQVRVLDALRVVQNLDRSQPVDDALRLTGAGAVHQVVRLNPGDPLTELAGHEALQVER